MRYQFVSTSRLVSRPKLICFNVLQICCTTCCRTSCTTNPQEIRVVEFGPRDIDLFCVFAMLLSAVNCFVSACALLTFSAYPWCPVVKLVYVSVYGIFVHHIYTLFYYDHPRDDVLGLYDRPQTRGTKCQDNCVTVMATVLPPLVDVSCRHFCSFLFFSEYQSVSGALSALSTFQRCIFS